MSLLFNVVVVKGKRRNDRERRKHSHSRIGRRKTAVAMMCHFSACLAAVKWRDEEKEML